MNQWLSSLQDLGKSARSTTRSELSSNSHFIWKKIILFYYIYKIRFLWPVFSCIIFRVTAVLRAVAADAKLWISFHPWRNHHCPISHQAITVAPAGASGKMSNPPPKPGTLIIAGGHALAKPVGVQPSIAMAGGTPGTGVAPAAPRTAIVPQVRTHTHNMPCLWIWSL